VPSWLQFLVDHQLTQPTATVIVGALAAIFAAIAIVTNRWATRMRATLDLLERLETHEYYQKRYRAFRKVRLETHGIHKIIIEISTGTEDTERGLCLDFLNVYELIALGIRKGILDEHFYRQAYESTLLRDWEAAKPLIDDCRNPADQTKPKNPTNFEHFEWLVKRCGTPTLLSLKIPPWT